MSLKLGKDPITQATVEFYELEKFSPVLLYSFIFCTVIISQKYFPRQYLTQTITICEKKITVK